MPFPTVADFRHTAMAVIVEVEIHGCLHHYPTAREGPGEEHPNLSPSEYLTREEEKKLQGHFGFSYTPWTPHNDPTDAEFVRRFLQRLPG